MRSRRGGTGLFFGLAAASIAGSGACNLVNGVDQFSLAGGAGGATTTTTTTGGGGAGGAPLPPSRAQWSLSIGGPEADAVSGISMKGNQAVITGFVSGVAMLGPLKAENAGLFVAAIRSDGKPIEVTTFPTGPSKNEAPPAIALLPDDTRVLAGVFSGSVNFGAGPMMTADSQLFVSTVGPLVANPWSFTAGKAVQWNGPRIAVDTKGGVAVFADGRGGEVSFGDKTYTGTDKSIAYLLRAGPDGAPLWSRTFSSGAHVYAGNIAIDPTDGASVYVAGKADVGPLGCGCSNSALDVLAYGMFVVRYDADGQCTQQWSYGENTPPHGLVVDSNGDVLLGGAHGGPFEVQGTMFDAPGGVANMDAYLLRFDKTGALLWGRSFGAPNFHDDVAEIAIGKAGDVFVTGHVGGPVDLGDGVTLESATTSDLYVARFSGKDGKALWAQRFSNKTVFSTLPASLAIDEQKNVLVGGLFTDTIDFGDADSPHVFAGGQDGYLVKLSPD